MPSGTRYSSVTVVDLGGGCMGPSCGGSGVEGRDPPVRVGGGGRRPLSAWGGPGGSPTGPLRSGGAAGAPPLGPYSQSPCAASFLLSGWSPSSSCRFCPPKLKSGLLLFTVVAASPPIFAAICRALCTASANASFRIPPPAGPPPPAPPPPPPPPPAARGPTWRCEPSPGRAQSRHPEGTEQPPSPLRERAGGHGQGRRGEPGGHGTAALGEPFPPASRSSAPRPQRGPAAAQQQGGREEGAAGGARPP